MSRNNRTQRRSIAAALLVVASLFTGCDFTKTMMGQALKGFVGYFDTPTSNGSKLTRLSDRVLTYNWYFDRTLVIEMDAGLVVVDSFKEDLSRKVIRELRAAGIDQPVDTLIYTHYHFDHTRGGAELAPRNVLCHVKCESYWDEHPPEDSREVLRPTRTVEGATRR